MSMMEMGIGGQPKPYEGNSVQNLIWQGKVGAFEAEVREKPEAPDSVTLVVFDETGKVLVSQPVDKPNPDDGLGEIIKLKRAGIKALDREFFKDSILTKIMRV